MGNWNKYLNNQKYSECQLVTALNAYYYLTGEVYCKQDSDEYEKLVDECCARHGSAIGIEKIHKKLGLEIIGYSNHISTNFENDWLTLRQIKNRKKGIYPKIHKPIKSSRGKITLPIEITIWHKKTGYHSAIIIDHCLKTECFKIANFSQVTSNKGWMFVEDLYLYINDMNKGWCFRLFGIKDKK